MWLRVREGYDIRHPRWKDPEGKIALVLQLILGGTFVYASLWKILDSREFIEAIDSYKVLSGNFARIAGYLLPWLEFLLGILLILGIAVRFCALCISFLLITFIVALASAILRGIDINCGCFVAQEFPASYVNDTPLRIFFAILRDLILLILALWIVNAAARTKNHRSLGFLAEKREQR